MRSSFRSFALGLLLSLVLLYLILVAQFRSFVDPFIILLAVPPGLTGVLLTLWVDWHDAQCHVADGRRDAGRHRRCRTASSSSSSRTVLSSEGARAGAAVATACRVRLRPVLMTSLATLIGLLPMALKLGEGSESYAPLALTLVGGLTVSVVCTVFAVPAGFSLAYRNRGPRPRHM